MSNYYNEFDPDTAEWLRELIMAGVIADGVVDTRSIEDVRPADLEGFTQCHFFAGIGVWSYALRAAGWPDDRPVWTGSCPCQPFSAAGKGIAFADERHLWPAFHHLIKVRKPECVLGEQVASAAVDPWIDLVHADLEALGYAFGSVPFPSAGVGAPHIRDRNYWVAHAGKEQRGRRAKQGPLQPYGPAAGRHQVAGNAQRGGESGRLAHDLGTGQRTPPGQRCEQGRAAGDAGAPGGSSGMDDAGGNGRPTRRDVDGGNVGQQLATTGQFQLGGLADSNGRHASAERQQRGGEQRQQQENGGSGGVAPIGLADDARSGRREERQDIGGVIVGDRAQGITAGFGDGGGHLRPGPTNGFWRAADWLGCRDGKWRPVSPGTFPLVAGASARVVRLRGYGNAINAIAAQTWIEVVMESIK